LSSVEVERHSAENFLLINLIIGSFDVNEIVDLFREKFECVNRLRRLRGGVPGPAEEPDLMPVATVRPTPDERLF
jgi:hypothetical protein